MSDALRKWKRGDITVRGGKVLRFIEEELEGEKWEVVAALAASPADVVGEIVAYLNNHDPLLADAIASRFSTGDGWSYNMEEAPRDGTSVIVPLRLELPAFYDAEERRWILSRELKMDYVKPVAFKLPPSPKGEG